jgi:hypothetical protein
MQPRTEADRACLSSLHPSEESATPASKVIKKFAVSTQISSSSDCIRRLHADGTSSAWLSSHMSSLTSFKNAILTEKATEIRYALFAPRRAINQQNYRDIRISHRSNNRCAT